MNPRMESPRNSSLSFDASLCCAPEACVKAASSSDLSLNSYRIRRWHSATSMAASALSRCSRRDMNSNAFWTKPKACFACMSNPVPVYFRGFSFGIEPSSAKGRMMEQALVALVATGLERPSEGWPTLGVRSLDSLYELTDWKGRFFNALCTPTHTSGSLRLGVARDRNGRRAQHDSIQHSRLG